MKRNADPPIMVTEVEPLGEAWMCMILSGWVTSGVYLDAKGVYWAVMSYEGVDNGEASC